MAQHPYETGECLNMHDGMNTFNVMDCTECGKSLKSCPVTEDLVPAYRLKYAAGTGASSATVVAARSWSTAS
eukprot:1932243-Prymnesium_polylepis.1